MVAAGLIGGIVWGRQPEGSAQFNRIQSAMLTYQSAEQLLARGRNGTKKLENNTYLHRVGSGIAVKLHATDVVVVTPDNDYILNTGGWQTVTTKARINDYSPARISQRKGLWYLTDGSIYQDGTILAADGTIKSGSKPAADVQALKAKVDKMVSKYIKGFVADAVKNGLQRPSSGDCLYCQAMDRADDVGHIFSHLEESYFVPSLLFNAIKERGANPAFVFQLCQTHPKEWIARELTGYLRKRKTALMEYISCS